MKLTLEYGARRNATPIVEALTGHGLAFDAIVRRDTWPDDLEIQVEGELEQHRLQDTVLAVANRLCPDEIMLPVRIIRADDKQDLLYGVPCTHVEKAIPAMWADISGFSDERDAFRSWFRSRWMGRQEEDELTKQELASEPLTATRILAFLDPREWRDWRPIQYFIERNATCNELIAAMASASTTTQKWRIAYALHRRRRSCTGAIPHLITFLEDADRQVREESADALGVVVMGLRGAHSNELRVAAGEALLRYVLDHPTDNLHFARTALGVTGYEPARAYLNRVAQESTGPAQESAIRGLENLDRTQSALARP